MPFVQALGTSFLFLGLFQGHKTSKAPPPPTLEEKLHMLSDKPLRENPRIVVFGNSHAQRLGRPHPAATLYDPDGPVASITYLGVGVWDPSDRYPSRRRLEQIESAIATLEILRPDWVIIMGFDNELIPPHPRSQRRWKVCSVPI